jgi:hypothetical protein
VTGSQKLFIPVELKIKLTMNYLNKKLYKMRILFYSEPLTTFKKETNISPGFRSWGLMILLGLLTSMVSMAQPCLTVNKTLIGVAPASSGRAGNIDATFEVEVTNTGCAIATSIAVTDNAASGSAFGASFVRSVGLPLLVYIDNPIPAKEGVINGGFTGAFPNDQLTDGSGFLVIGERVVYQLTFELNPRAPGAPAVLSNTASAVSTIPADTRQFSPPAEIPNCWSNCQMACNNSVNISVNSSCEADILAEMILEGESGVCADLGFYQVTITYNNQVLSLPLGRNYIGKKLTATVRNIVCGNSCWGNLVLEDKTPPVLVCKPRDTFRCNVNLDPRVFGFPVNPILVNTTVYPFIVNGVDACGSVTLTYRDSVAQYDCTNPVLSATVYRRWCARDASGFQNCCTDTIDLRRGTIADITLPPHFDGQPGHNAALKCDGAWKRLPNGFPDTSEVVFDGLGNLTGGTGMPSGIFCGNIQFEFSDDTIKVCNGSYKLLRKWLIIDWCNPNNRVNYIQLIKVVDEQPPLVVCPTTITISTSAHSCTGSFILPVPQALLPNIVPDGRTPYVVENCSNWTYSVAHLPAIDPADCTPDPNQAGSTRNITRMADGRYRVDNMPLGCNWIYYTICDECGNCETCTFDILVEDKTPPVAVCQQQTVVSLTSNGRATVAASVFNGGSNDNCAMGRYQIRRMNFGPCGVAGTFRADSISFCCADIARNPVRIVLTVYDRAGNSSECMADVVVQDKLPPRITCPKDTLVYCETDISNLSVFGNASASDNCGYTITQRTEFNLNNCNTGTIRRWFVATDDGGRKDSCYQTITVVDTAKFRLSDIHFPDDITLTGCRGDVSPEVTGKPQYRNRDRCNQIIANYKDIDFNFVDGVCHKILRTWTVIDWCQYDAHDPSSNVGIWSKVQVIMVSENRGPDFTSSCADRELCITSGCSVVGSFSATATDNCTDQQDLQWAYRLDRGNNGTTDQSGPNRSFSANLVEGTHRVTFISTDLCGNSSTCSYLVRVRDCKAPTPYCNPGIITVIMPSSGNVTIWAKDFDLGSFDNCTDTSKLKFSFSSNVNEISKTITCADLPNGREVSIEVDIYVTDEAGNQDFCRTRLIVQDNQDVCPNSLGGQVAGLVRVANQSLAPNVTVRISQESTGEQKESVTIENGTYSFFDLELSKDYELRASYTDENPLQGVSTRDIIAIQKHILGIEKLSDQYKQIAADVNKSASITARDISDIRKLILGVHDKFEDCESWAFVNSNYSFDPADPFKYQDFIRISNLNKAMMENDFVAIKMGDVTGEAGTGNAVASKTRSNKVFGFELPSLSAKAGELIQVPVFANSSLTNLEGFQMEWVYNIHQMMVEDLVSGVLPFDPSHYRINEEKVRISWNGKTQVRVNEGEVLFYIVVRALENLDNSEFNARLDNLFPSELYAGDEDYRISLLSRSEENVQEVHSYALYQNVPNPFRGVTTIYYELPKDEEVKISLFDLSGKLIRSSRLSAVKGLNYYEVNMDAEQSGIIYYQLETNDFVATRKMVVIK